jgi:hypothetical protein
VIQIRSMQLELPLIGPQGPGEELTKLRAKLGYGTKLTTAELERLKELLAHFAPGQARVMFQQMVAEQ